MKIKAAFPQFHGEAIFQHLHPANIYPANFFGREDYLKGLAPNKKGTLDYFTLYFLLFPTLQR
ncbi:hypothetical protein [Alcanivorax sp.]|jgi:hypothetical protein|uniref:hypothetical protein n=1 Tax=Alcanivorax sp. TaxID=1872427 RepID=UPI0032D97382